MSAHQSLICHPATPSDAIRCVGVTVDWSPDGGDLNLRYAVHGEMSRLAVPVVGPPTRRDRLWEHTCFEMFVAIPGNDGYREFNFSPSSAWACYAFTAYRQGMSAPPVSVVPRVSCNASPVRLDVLIELPGVPDLSPSEESAALRLGLCAVLEERTGTKSYWALKHSDGEPDFHDPAGFLWVLDRAGLRGADRAAQSANVFQSTDVAARELV